MIDVTKTWPRSKIVFETFNLLRQAFSQCFYATIRKVLYVTNNLVSRGRALRKKSVVDSLYVAANQKPSCNFRSHHRKLEALEYPPLSALCQFKGANDGLRID